MPMVLVHSGCPGTLRAQQNPRPALEGVSSSHLTGGAGRPGLAASAGFPSDPPVRPPLTLGCLFPGTVLDHLVGEETLADYLLYTLNRHQLLG